MTLGLAVSRSAPGQSNEIDLKRNIPEHRVELAVKVKQQAGAPPMYDDLCFIHKTLNREPV